MHGLHYVNFPSSIIIVAVATPNFRWQRFLTIDQYKAHAYITTINYVHTRIRKLTYPKFKNNTKQEALFLYPCHVNCTIVGYSEPFEQLLQYSKHQMAKTVVKSTMPLIAASYVWANIKQSTLPKCSCTNMFPCQL